jgi:CheY-like chemotaxis protein
VQIRVVDNGVGMSADTRERVFDPYFSTRGGARGTGLGLPIVRRIVYELGGEITVSSILGQGSVFSVELPAATEVVFAEPEPGKSTPPGADGAETSGGLDHACRGLRVLVVDDESAVRRALARMLTSLGSQVVEAGSAAEARAILDQGDRSFDLLLTDFRMPGESGIQLIRQVLREQPGLAVLLTSGNFDEAGGDDDGVEAVTYLQKPFDLGELGRAVGEAVDRRDRSYGPVADPGEVAL